MLTINLFFHALQNAFYFTIMESSRTAWLCAHQPDPTRLWNIYPVEPDFRGHEEVAPETDFAAVPLSLKESLANYLNDQKFRLSATPVPPKGRPLTLFYANTIYEVSEGGKAAFEDMGGEVCGGEVTKEAATLSILITEGVRDLPREYDLPPDMLGSLAALISAAELFARKINSGDIVEPRRGATDWTEVMRYNTPLQVKLADARMVFARMRERTVKTPARLAELESEA